MARYQVTCINKDDRYNPYERIQYIGGAGWKVSQMNAIIHIDGGTHSYYVSVGGREVDVITAVSPYGHKYLKTRADSLEPNNLLSLPECP